MGESLGEYLQEARKTNGLTLEQAAEKTRILPEYLKALEENNYARLPDEVFAKGFVRAYARVLGLGETEVIQKFNETGGQFYARRIEREQLQQKQREEERRRKVNQFIVLGMVGVALVILFVLIGPEEKRGGPPTKPEPIVPALPQPPAAPAPSQIAPVAPSKTPTQAPIESAPPEVEGNFSGAPLEGIVPEPRKLVLDIEAIERCWILVQADDTPQQDIMLNPGERGHWNARERFTVTLGNAGGVRVLFNGKLEGPFGPSGKVAKGIVFSR